MSGTTLRKAPHLSLYLSRSPLVPTVTAISDECSFQLCPLTPTTSSSSDSITIPSFPSNRSSSSLSSDSTFTVTLPLAHNFPELRYNSKSPPVDTDTYLPSRPRSAITPDEVLCLLDLLHDLDVDASSEVARVKLAIRETRGLIRECRERRRR